MTSEVNNSARYDGANSAGYDVAIIGLGRVGLPLALGFAHRGLRVLGIERDPGRVDSIRAGTMPFDEPGAQELLDEVHAAGCLAVSETPADAALADDIVITLGTP